MKTKKLLFTSNVLRTVYLARDRGFYLFYHFRGQVGLE